MAQYVLPASYAPDRLTNNEIGLKAEFLNRRLQWNGALYRENWNNVQVAFFNPGIVGNVFYDTNGQDFLLKGIETSIVARLMRGLTVQGAASWNHSEQTNSPKLINNNLNVGQEITQSCGGSYYTGVCVGASNPFGPAGAPTANSPPIQFSLRARYEWSIGDYLAFAQAGAVHTGHSFTQAGANPSLDQAGAISTGRLRFEDPAFTTYDASFGVAKDAWNLSVFGENLSNSNAAVFTSTDQFIVAQTPVRPRVIGVSFGYKF